MKRFCIMMVVGSLLAASAQGGTLPQPPDYALQIPNEDYGTDANVDLLKGMLADKDETVRERAIINLGQTHNPLAVPLLATGLQDTQYVVRAAAMSAAGDFAPSQVKDIIAGGLKDADPRVLCSAMRTVRQLQASEHAAAVTSLLGSTDRLIRAVALETLTALGVAAPGETLRAMLNDESTTVRLRAAQNALCLKSAAILIDKLQLLADSDSPAVRCAAITALGKFDFAASGQKIAGYTVDKDPMVRLGAVRAYEQAKQDKQILRFLEIKQGKPAEASDMVRLAAIQAAGALKSADCVDSLGALMLTAPMGEPSGLDSHVASLDSLAAIGNQDVAKVAAAALPGLIDEYKAAQSVFKAKDDAVKAAQKDAKSVAPEALAAMQKDTDIAKAKYDVVARNIRACCRLLGATRSKLVLDQQIAFLEYLADDGTDSPVLGELALSLGQIGDPKAGVPMTKLFTKLVGLAKRYVETRKMQPPPPVAYSEEAIAKVVTAVTALRLDASFEDIQKLMKLRGDGLILPEIAIARSYQYWQKAHRADVEKTLAAMVGDMSLASPVVRYNLIKQAGKLKVKSAVKNIQNVLDKERPSRAMILAAAWAIQEITGKTPPIPQPATVSGDGNWIITVSGPK